MRKLLVPTSLAALAAAPAALAAGPPLVTSPTAEGDQVAIDRSERSELRREARKKRRQAIRRARRKAQPAVTLPPQLEAIALCESGGNPRAVGGGGAYRGKYQFSYSTWASVGGSGDPAAAPEAEQDRRAAILYARSGPSQWPVCGG